MHSVIALGSNRPLALGKDSCLPCHVCQSSDDHLVAVHETVERIRYVDLFTELLHQLLRLPQVVSRDTRVQVVDGLELEPSVEEV